jgi:hypothetical protein
MSKCIYGVDTKQSVTAVHVRDAIVKCFMQAHESVLEDMKEYGEFKSKKEFEDMKHINIKVLVETFFREAGGDFKNPTKESIIKVIGKLKEYAKNFRKPVIVEKHAREIMVLVSKLP